MNGFELNTNHAYIFSFRIIDDSNLSLNNKLRETIKILKN